jgi:hypothetical protein
MKKLLGLLLASMFVFAVTTPMRGQEGTAAKKPSIQARWDGTVVGISSVSSTLQVRQVNNNALKTIYFDSTTAWNSQYHGDKTVNKIDPSQVKEGDRVICLGTYNEKKEFHATTISKRLSHSPQ